MRLFFHGPEAGQPGAFLESDTHGDAIPKGAVKVSARRHATLLAAQDEGATILADGKGHPQAVFPDAAQLRAGLAAAIRREARRRCLRISPLWRQMNDMRSPSEAGTARFAAIDAVRAASTDIEAALADLADAQLADFNPSDRPEWPQEPA